jgi:hypothetical protein
MGGGDAHPHLPVLGAAQPVVEAAEPLVDSPSDGDRGGDDALFLSQPRGCVGQRSRVALQRLHHGQTPASLVDHHPSAERGADGGIRLEPSLHRRIEARKHEVVTVQ